MSTSCSERVSPVIEQETTKPLRTINIMKEVITDKKMINQSTTMKASTMEELAKSGVTIGGFKFVAGDRVGIPDQIEIFSEGFKSRDDKKITYYLIKCKFNNDVRGIPTAAFRKDRVGIEELVTEYHTLCPIARTLAGFANDAERVMWLTGKVLKVKDIFKGRSYQFDPATQKKISYDSSKPETYVSQGWPIFEIEVE